MRQLILSGLIWLSAAWSCVAEGERAGDFDYYVLSLSWSPNWCATTGDHRESEQCDPARDLAGSCMVCGRNTKAAGPVTAKPQCALRRAL